MRKNLLLIIVTMFAASLQAQTIDIGSTEEYSPYVFGHNLEHTRAAINGGLSAQMLKNRKFAGKPSRSEGVAAHWFAIGEKAFFTLEISKTYTRHTHMHNMHRWNELGMQCIQNIKGGNTAGFGQYELALQKGKEYSLRTVTQVNVPVTLCVKLTNRTGDKIYATHSLELTPAGNKWIINEFSLTPSADDNDAVIRYTFTDQAMLKIGALSMMPSDNFHGMRRDVVENLKAIGPKLLRWPGGNFAGEYRWKDGLLPVDERAPLGAATEIETQPYTDGYDYHEINTDDFILLCREVGAEPMLTINAVWSTPEESAEWVEYCNGDENSKYGKIRIQRGFKEPFNVKFWSLGNEMGYFHMEGPKAPADYAKMARSHADAMLKANPDLELCSSGLYPNDNWAQKSAAPLADLAPYVSLHYYSHSKRHFTTPEDIKKSYEETVADLTPNINRAKRMRESLDKTGKKMHISFDEWNQWYAWYRPSCVSEGMYTARMLHFFITDSNALDMPIVCYFQPVGEGAIIIEPTSSHLSANGQMFAVMKEHQGGKLCKVSDNEDYSTVATVKDGILTITLINKEYEKSREFDFCLDGKILDAQLYYSDDVTPYSYFEKSKLKASSAKKHISTMLPPHSVALLRVKLK